MIILNTITDTRGRRWARSQIVLIFINVVSLLLLPSYNRLSLWHRGWSHVTVVIGNHIYYTHIGKREYV